MDAKKENNAKERQRSSIFVEIHCARQSEKRKKKKERERKKVCKVENGSIEKCNLHRDVGVPNCVSVFIHLSYTVYTIYFAIHSLLRCVLHYYQISSTNTRALSVVFVIWNVEKKRLNIENVCKLIIYKWNIKTVSDTRRRVKNTFNSLRKSSIELKTFEHVVNAILCYSNRKGVTVFT